MNVMIKGNFNVKKITPDEKDNDQKEVIEKVIGILTQITVPNDFNEE